MCDTEHILSCCVCRLLDSWDRDEAAPKGVFTVAVPIAGQNGAILPKFPFVHWSESRICCVPCTANVKKRSPIRKLLRHFSWTGPSAESVNERAGPPPGGCRTSNTYEVWSAQKRGALVRSIMLSLETKKAPDSLLGVAGHWTRSWHSRLELGEPH